MFTVKTEFGNYPNCFFEINKYRDNDHIAVSIFSSEEGPFSPVTVNISGIERFPKNYSCVDTNNAPFIEKLIKKLGIATPAGITLKSGWCTYPVYIFDEDKLSAS